MEFAYLLLKKMFTLGLMITMGAVTVKSGHLKSKDSTVISNLCFDWVIPASLISSFFIEYSAETARDFKFACLAASASILFCILLTMILKRFISLNPSEQGSMMFSNSAGMTLPLAMALFGSTGLLYCAPHMVIQNFVIFMVMPVVMSKESGGINWKKILLNRNTLATAVGCVLFFGQIKLPGVLEDTIRTVGGTLGVFCMFMIGMLMGEVDFRKLLRDKGLYLAAAMRLIIYPLLTILIIAASGITRAYPFTRNILLVMVMCTASPAASLVTQMANAYRGIEEAKTAGSLNVGTTLLCVVTIPVMVLIYQQLC